MKNLFILLTWLLACTTHATLIQAPTLADSLVRLGQAANNFGTAGDLAVKNSGSTSTTRKGYLKFDVSSLLAETIVNATLSLEVTGNNNGGSPLDPTPFAYMITVYGLNDGHSGETWIEGNGGADNSPVDELTWNNAPGNDLAGNGILSAETTDLGSFVTPELNPVNEANPIIVDFSTQALADFLAADSDGLATLILVRTSTNGNNLSFASKEKNGFLPPTLMVNTIPEPSSALLLVLGAATIGTFKRRRQTHA